MATKVALVFSLRLPRSVREQAVRAAREEGLSLNQLIVLALVEKIIRLDAGKLRESERPESL
jgi:predicted HicB family RNase H-like nuclease